MTQITPDKENFSYLPHTRDDREQMLRSIGVTSFEELLSHIPEAVRTKELDIPAGMSELELGDFMRSLAARNQSCSQLSSFLGGGAYRRFTPAAIASIVSRSEFLTAYTPYQPEVSQGTLQVIYEFQTAICLLTGMEAANASVYDGATACAEASLMSCRLTSRKKVVLAESINTEYAQVTKTYLETCGIEAQIVAGRGATVKTAELDLLQAACLVVQYPNYYGCLEELDTLSEAAHNAGALLVVVCDPVNLGLLEPPGKFGADIVVGDAQQCGNGLSFGGPSAGFMATRNQYVRQLPGRLCGMTLDSRGDKSFTLTLQTREQHIRRAKATSNICTNQSLNALTMLVYLALMGPNGLRELVEISMLRAHKLQELLCAIPGIKLKFDAPFVNEFLLELDLPVEKVLGELKERGILAGIAPGKFNKKLENCLLVAVTEMNSPAEIERYAEQAREVFLAKAGQNDSKSSTQVAGCRQ
jgi:glycine dehydrogenase subunit 1